MSNYSNRPNIRVEKRKKKSWIRRLKPLPCLVALFLLIICISVAVKLIQGGKKLLEEDNSSILNPNDSRESVDDISSDDTSKNDTPPDDDTSSKVDSPDDNSSKDDKGNNNLNLSDWRLILVNAWNKMPDDYNVSLTYLKNGHAIDERAYPDLMKMIDDCRAAGLSPVICSSFRTNEKQSELFSNNKNKYLAQGYSEEDAYKEAAKSVAIPGTSEHQLGLAVDIVDQSYQHLDNAQESTEVQKWLMSNSWKYGFILRYPNNKSDVTGIIYEPWHYRYVGKEYAKDIYEKNVCLEEYITNG